MKLTFSIISFLFFVQITAAQPVVGKRHFYLYLLAGQSNMAGRGKVEAADTIINNRIWVLNKKGDWLLAKEPLHFDKPDVVGVGPGFSFAKKMAAVDSNIIIGLIPCAVGGSSIYNWQHAQYFEPTKSYPYDDAINRTKLALQIGTLKGILWQQGESDCDSVRSVVYSSKLMALVKSFRKDLKIKSLPFLAGTIAPFYEARHPFAKQINEAIEGLPATLRRTAVVDSDGLMDKGDATHFNSESARELGVRYATVFISIFSKK